jgi:branched-chain amino acid transport system permease protein
MNWVLIPQAIVTGLLNGGIIALIALGVVLIFKSSEVFNFAQGHLLMLGAFVTWWFAGARGDGSEVINLPLGLAVLAAFVTAMLLGFAIERLALRPMTGQPLLSIILMTLGLSQLLEGIAVLLFGVQPRDNFPTPLGLSPADVFIIPFPGAFNDAIRLSKILLLAFVVAIVSTIIFAVFFRFTRTGLAMRATSEDHELARSVGLSVPRVFALSWAIAGMIATAGGVLLATLSGATLTLATVVLVAFPAILLGGLESLPGAIIGGIFVGLAQAFVQTAKLPEIRNSAEIAPYIVLLIVLFIRPEGLFGRERIERI